MAPMPRSIPSVSRRRQARRTLAGLAAFGGLFCGACDRGDYPRDTPDALVRSAVAMVEQGDAERLTDLVLTSDPRSDALLARFGLVLGEMQALGDAVQGAFPEEVAELRANSEGTGGALGDLFGSLASAAPNRRAGVGFGPLASVTSGSDADGSGRAAVGELLADPLGWLENAGGENFERIGFEEIDDDLVAVTWDDEPVLPPVGLVLERFGGQWYWAPPVDLLPMQMRPRSDEQYSIWASLFRVFENLFADLRGGVETGEYRSLNDLSEAAGEKAFLPMVLVFYAYTRANSDEDGG